MTTRLCLILALSLTACGTRTAPETEAPEQATVEPVQAATTSTCPEVQVFGSMARFADGDLSQTVDLSALSWTESTIALGATTDKTAEITTVDGQLWVVTPAEDGVDVVHAPEGQGASLLAVSTPEAWDAGRAIEGVDVASILTDVHTQRAGTLCADADAVPFIVRGHADALTWSIVGQPSGKQGSEEDVDVVIVGIWAPGAKGVYVPGSLDGHLHITVPETNVAGHVVSIRLQPGAMLYLPGTEGESVASGGH